MLVNKSVTVALALLIALAGAEIVARQLQVDQAPALAWDATNKLLIHQPHATGIRYLDGQPVRYTINAQGWNSVFPDYARSYDTHLAVVIGDSFVEALQVDPTESMAWKLQKYLPSGWTVYPMGMSGAPLSQYLQMARYAERTWHPDIIIVVLVHNDFIESYDPPKAELYRSFWTATDHSLVLPQDYVPRLSQRIMSSEWATGRLAVKLARETQAADMTDWKMGVDVPKMIRQEGQTRSVTDYLFGQFAQIKSALLFAMDAPREDIENETFGRVYRLNMLADALANKNHIRLINLVNAFADDWQLNHRKFSFPSDYHWNSYAHDLVARTLLPLVVHQ